MDIIFILQVTLSRHHSQPHTCTSPTREPGLYLVVPPAVETPNQPPAVRGFTTLIIVMIADGVVSREHRAWCCCAPAVKFEPRPFCIIYTSPGMRRPSIYLTAMAGGATWATHWKSYRWPQLSGWFVVVQQAYAKQPSTVPSKLSEMRALPLQHKPKRFPSYRYCIFPSDEWLESENTGRCIPLMKVVSLAFITCIHWGDFPLFQSPSMRTLE